MANDLLRQLIASPHALPRPQARSLVVAPNAPLPANLRFGPTNPSQVTNSPYTGGSAGTGINLVHPEPPPVFQAPQYAPLGAVSPAHNLISALAPILGAVLAGGLTGATTPPQVPPHLTTPRPVATAGSGTGFPRPPATDTSGTGFPRPPGAVQGPITSGPVIAALARVGQRLGSLRSGPGYY